MERRSSRYLSAEDLLLSQEVTFLGSHDELVAAGEAFNRPCSFTWHAQQECFGAGKTLLYVEKELPSLAWTYVFGQMCICPYLRSNPAALFLCLA